MGDSAEQLVWEKQSSGPCVTWAFYLCTHLGGGTCSKIIFSGLQWIKKDFALQKVALLCKRKFKCIETFGWGLTALEPVGALG